ncbi:MAG: DUF4395 domain-containing protein [Chloroflexi bacterium]|nr:DUF4395 domain-containing protein [Chloroflexota bacterium]
MRAFFSFPNPVNEIAARLVAGGVVGLTAAILVSQQPWLIVLLAFGFVARVLTGPRVSPLALLVTRVVVPRLGIAERPVPGTPKRFAQGIGASLSVFAVVAAFGFGADLVAYALVGAILVAASLEAFVGFCMGCTIFAWLMRVGVIPESACEACIDITKRRAAA